MVIDADTLKLVGEIPDTAGVHGIAIASGPRAAGSPRTAAREALTIFDLATPRPSARPARARTRT